MRPRIPFPDRRPSRRWPVTMLVVALAAVGLAVVPGPVLRFVDDFRVDREPLRFAPVVAARGGEPEAPVDAPPVDAPPVDAPPVESEIAEVDPFVTIGVAMPEEPATPVEIRWRDGDGWSGWQELEVESDAAPDPSTPEAASARQRAVSQPLWVGRADAYQVRLPGGAEVPEAEALVVRADGGHLEVDTAPVEAGAQSAGRPAIRTRGEWGARGPSNSVGTASQLRIAVVHHSATGNDYSPGDVPGIIRSIQAFHMDGNGWSDIGYNFVVDKYGGMWEGRDGSLLRNSIGAHAEGFNTGSVGVVALGNMTSGSPSNAQVVNIADIIAWKFANSGVDPSTNVSFTSGGSSRYPAGTVVDLPRVVGHRDVGQTDCPGANLYPQLVSRIRPALPDLVAGKASPIGSLDVVAAGPRSVTVAGWALDPLNPDPIDVHVYVDGAGYNLGPTPIDRPDLAGPFPDGGTRHGFSTTVTGVEPGDHKICAWGINTGPGSNTVIGCRTVTVRSGAPFGAVDLALGGPDGSLTVTGWSIDPDTAASTEIHVYVDGRGVNLGRASGNRPDLAAAFPGYGAAHGFAWSRGGMSPGRHDVCVFAIDTAAPGGNTLLDCRSVVVPGGAPFGAIDVLQGGPDGTIAFSGWAIDPDTAGAAQVHLYIDGRGDNLGPTPLDRPDLAAAFPGYGARHGVARLSTGWSPGRHTGCVFAVDTGGGAPTLLGCRDVVVPAGSPFGVVDAAVPVGGGRVAVSGWAIDPDTASAIDVHVYIDAGGYQAGLANGVRPDVAAANPGYGAGHGFSWVSPPLPPGPKRVCTFGINRGAGGNVPIDCRQVTV